MSEKSNYEKLAAINVNDKTEKKGRFTYLSWAWAADQLLRLDPDATWTFGEPMTLPDGSMLIFCTVTAFGKSMVCQMPVLNHQNKAIQKPNAFDVNTAMMRGLAKCIALHGLGIYIYAGEDLPHEEGEGEKQYVNPHEDASKKNEAVKDTFKARLNGAKSMEELDSAMKECEACFNTWPDAWIDGMNALFVKREKELR